MPSPTASPPGPPPQPVHGEAGRLTSPDPVPGDIPPLTLQLLILYRHLILHPEDGHSPYRLLRTVPRLQSKTLHKTMRSLEDAGILVCTRVRQHPASANDVRRKDYRLTRQGYAYILQELGAFQLPPDARQIPPDLPEGQVGPVTPRLRPDVKRRAQERREQAGKDEPRPAGSLPARTER